MGMIYTVERPEVHYSIHEVEATDPEAAIQLVMDGDGENEVGMEYSHTLDRESWRVYDRSGLVEVVKDKSRKEKFFQELHRNITT